MKVERSVTEAKKGLQITPRCAEVTGLSRVQSLVRALFAQLFALLSSDMVVPLSFPSVPLAVSCDVGFHSLLSGAR